MLSLRSPFLLLSLAAHVLITCTAVPSNIVKIDDQTALEVISEEIFRVFRCGDGCNAVEQMQQRNSLVVLDSVHQQTVEHGSYSHDGVLTIYTPKMTAFVFQKTGYITFFQEGEVLVREHSSTISSDDQTVNQEFTILGEREALYGGGEYVNGFLNYRSAPVLMNQFNTEAAVPFIVSSNKYGILWDLYGETLMNAPEQEIVLDEKFQGSFTPETEGGYWFYLEVCKQKFGCGSDAVNVTVTDDHGSSQVICEHSLANIPVSTACRVEGLTKGTKYKVVMEGAFAERKLFVTSIETHNKLAFKTQANSVIDYYLMGSSNRTVEGVIRNYRRLTGPAKLYPRWVYGFWQCKEHYHNQTELLEAAAKFRSLRIPMDAIVQDWLYWGDLGWGPQWDSKVYPDPKAMIQTLHDDNIQFMVSVWSKFETKTRFYQEMKQAGVLINASTYMDAWNPKAQELFYKYVQDAHFSIGADALWLDATEPENHDEKGQAIYLGSGDEYANTFSLMVAKTVHDGLLKNYPDRRVFSLTRSSFAGQQRYGAALWSGDTTGSWDSLRRQIAMSINYQLSGIPYWSMDTGGFFRPDDQYTNSDYHHLLIRWFQFAVFTPIFRVHGGGSDTELWNYGTDVQDTIVESAIRFRYRLLEYMYSGFWKVETEHYTMQRGLILDYGEDENVLDIPDQFMFGQSFLVAPIYQPNSSRSIYLPKLKSGKWRCFYSGNELEDGKSIQFDNISISRIPLFVRSSILVLGPDGRQHVDDPDQERKLEVRVYDGANAQFILFEDDGVSGDPGRPTTTIAFSWNDKSRMLTIGDASGATKRTIDVVLVRPGVGVGIDEVTQPDATLTYDGTAKSVKLPTKAAMQA